MGSYDKLSKEELARLLGESEALLRQKTVSSSQRLLQDLQLHKIELEIQNRELRESKLALEQARDRYAQLYDLAPIGYLTLDPRGLILGLNLTAANMLGHERSALLRKPIVGFVSPASRGILLDHVRQTFASVEQIASDLSVEPDSSASTLELRMESRAHTDDQGVEHCLSTLTDITARKQAETDLRKERTFLQKLIDGIDDPILVISPDYQVRRMNRVARDIAEASGLTLEKLTCHQLSHKSEQPCSGEDHPCPLQAVLMTRLPQRMVHNHIAPNGQLRTFEVAASPLFDEAGQVAGIIEVSHDITEHLALLDRLRERELSYAHLAQHDALTGLPNRLLFADRLSQAMHAAHRGGSKLAVLFIDLDRFKEVNDSFDHGVGDIVLKAVAERLQALFREDDTIARMGGDEFTVILGNIHQVEDAARVARKILMLFKTPFEVQDHLFFLGASIGISLYPDHGMSVDDLVRNADAAMYRAKESGRNTFQYYKEELTAQAFRRVLLESSLHRALEKNELVLYFQPQFDLTTGGMQGLEVLIRWQHSDLGLISPSTFIPLAEESGLIIPIGEWVLYEACQQMKAWQDNALLDPDLTVSVNLSGKQFDQRNLLEVIENILRDTRLEPAKLELEITETTAMRTTDCSTDNLNRLRELGIRIAIDDFGTGYSSLNYLKRLPITRLKIDQSFVSDIPKDLNDVAITKAIIAMATSLSLDVLAEGIETEEQKLFLMRQGCHSGQGYLYSHPLPANGLENFVRQGEP